MAGAQATMGQVLELHGQDEVLWHYMVRVAGEVGTKLLPGGLAGSTECRCLW